MDFAGIIDLVQGVGFPAAVAWFVLARVEKRLAAIEAAVCALSNRGDLHGHSTRAAIASPRREEEDGRVTPIQRPARAASEHD